MAVWLSVPALAQLAADLSIPPSSRTHGSGAGAGVARPATPREFAASLLNGVDSSGNPQTTLTLDIAPYWLAGRPSGGQANYKANPIVSIARRFPNFPGHHQSGQNRKRPPVLPPLR